MIVRRITAILGTANEPERVKQVEFANGEIVEVENVTAEEWAAVGLRVTETGDLVALPTKLN